MKIKHLYFGITILIVGFLSLAAIKSDDAKDPGKTNKDLIKFSHSFHKELAQCSDCHTKVSESTSLDDRLLPTMENCAGCHDVEDENNCKQCHYEDVLEPLIQKESSVKFNHKLHISDNKLECVSCHKGLDGVDYGFESKETYPPMTTCYGCHNNNTVATSECIVCHKSTVDLIPTDHREVSFLKTHKFRAMSSNENCAMCHDNSFCETCHASTNMITEKNTASDFYVPYSPHKFTDNAKEQQITRVHDLNFRYSHGIEAKGKTAECQTCHEVQTFCAECHTSGGGDFAMEGTMPSSHKAPNFVTIGVGSGGGRHAIDARRDLESCQSCHDVQGGDPVCILCHTDADGIKGTNPRTHTGGFMRDNHGDWHTDEGSVCYTCHRDANARPGGVKGIGFCGYCHN